MANPVVKSFVKNVWEKVASGVTTGVIHKMSKAVNYLQTYRMAGDAAPTDLTDAVRAFIESDVETISSSAAIDVYLYPENEAGKVRVDL